MGSLHIRIGRGASRLPAAIGLSLIPSLPRPVLEWLAQQIIDHLDDTDGDTDVEANGDEGDYTGGEDDMDPTHVRCFDNAAGCPASDPGGYAQGEGPNLPPPTYDGEDQSYIILPAPRGIEPTRYRVS